MMLVIVKMIMSGRTFGGMGVCTQNNISSTYGISYHIGAVHQVKNEKSLVTKFACLYRTYLVVCLTTRTRRKMSWIAVG